MNCVIGKALRFHRADVDSVCGKMIAAGGTRDGEEWFFSDGTRGREEDGKFFADGVDREADEMVKRAMRSFDYIS